MALGLAEGRAMLAVYLILGLVYFVVPDAPRALRAVLGFPVSSGGI